MIDYVTNKQRDEGDSFGVQRIDKTKGCTVCKGFHNIQIHI